MAGGRYGHSGAGDRVAAWLGAGVFARLKRSTVTRGNDGYAGRCEPAVGWWDRPSGRARGACCRRMPRRRRGLARFRAATRSPPVWVAVAVVSLAPVGTAAVSSRSSPAGLAGGGVRGRVGADRRRRVLRCGCVIGSVWRCLAHGLCFPMRDGVRPVTRFMRTPRSLASWQWCSLHPSQSSSTRRCV